jgi:PAS domain S-box-containing protein
MDSIIKVLYVDDEPDMLEIGKILLESEDPNLKVDTIVSARLAMKHLHKHKYDVIVSDYKMTDMDGITFLKHLHVSGNTTPVILFTGKGREELEIQAFNEGADDYVEKGCNPKLQFMELAHKIRRSSLNHRLKEENLKYAERFKNVFDAINEFIFEMDAHATITFVSNKVKDVIGYEPRQVIGKTPLDFIGSTDEIKRVSALLAEYGKNPQKIYHMEFHCLSKDVREITLKITAAPMYDETKKFIGYQGSIEDITESNRLKEKQIFTNIILKTQMETSLDGILVIDDKGNILQYNRNFVIMWGIPKLILESRLDKDTIDVVLEKLKYPDEFLARVSELYTNKTEKSRENVYLKDGRVFDRYSAPMIENGKYYGRVWYFREIER